MKHAKLNHNKQFMFGIMAMALIVITVVVLFWLWCFPLGAAEPEPKKHYEISLVGFRGDSVQVSLDDELLMESYVRTDTCVLGSDYAASQAVLMVGCFRTDEVVTFEITEQESPVCILREGGTIKIQKK